MISVRTSVLMLLLAAVALGGAATPADSATSPVLAPESLARAGAIRIDISAAYGLLPGRKLAVTEATGTGVVGSLTLITDWLEPWRVAPAGNGIYFALCAARARCPYPAPAAAWPKTAYVPRRAALELAVRTLLETSADLVVVALPTARPTWIVFERDLLATVDAAALRDRLSMSRGVGDPVVRELVEALTRPRLYMPLPVLPLPDRTMYALRVYPSA